MSIQFSRQGMAALPVSFARPRSSFVRRLLRARDDAAKQRVRAWLTDLDDERLLAFGLAPEDIALLREFSDQAGVCDGEAGLDDNQVRAFPRR